MKKIVLGQNNIRSNEDGSVEIGNVADYMKISSRGNVSASGEATWFDDIRVEPTVRSTSIGGSCSESWTY